MQHPIDALLEQAAKAMDNFEPQLALQFYNRAYETEPSNTIAQLIGQAYVSLLDHAFSQENYQNALQWLLISVQAEQEDMWASYVLLGQLHQGPESVQYYEKGLDLLYRFMQTSSEKVP